ncbi:MAG: protein kinase [Parachlamydiaceae bacterium]|nr:protein kinase [Parachlamydiaceae bacterium]
MPNIFCNTTLNYSEKNLLEHIGDECFAPIRYLFNGLKITIVQKNIADVEVEYPQGHWAKTAAAINILIPSLLLGTLLKGLATISPSVREYRNITNEYFADENNTFSNQSLASNDVNNHANNDSNNDDNKDANNDKFPPSDNSNLFPEENKFESDIREDERRPFISSDLPPVSDKNIQININCSNKPVKISTESNEIEGKKCSHDINIIATKSFSKELKKDVKSPHISVENQSLNNDKIHEPKVEIQSKTPDGNSLLDKSLFERAKALSEVAEEMGNLHKNNQIYSNFKLDKVLIDITGKASLNKTTILSRPGECRSGSSAYKAPETLNISSKDYIFDTKVDSFSLGICSLMLAAPALFAVDSKNGNPLPWAADQRQLALYTQIELDDLYKNANDLILKNNALSSQEIFIALGLVNVSKNLLSLDYQKRMSCEEAAKDFALLEAMTPSVEVSENIKNFSYGNFDLMCAISHLSKTKTYTPEKLTNLLNSVHMQDYKMQNTLIEVSNIFKANMSSNSKKIVQTSKKENSYGFTLDGDKVYVRFDVIGTGANKKVRKALGLHSLKECAHQTIKAEDSNSAWVETQNTIKALDKLKNCRHIIPKHKFMTAVDGKKQRKYVLITKIFKGNSNLLLKTPLTVRAKALQDAAEGLSDMHDRHFIYSDFKLDNMLLDEYYHGFLSDFGTLSTPTKCMGASRAYQPPESLDEKSPQYIFGTKSDSWSLGICMLMLAAPKLFAIDPETNNLDPWISYMKPFFRYQQADIEQLFVNANISIHNSSTKDQSDIAHELLNISHELLTIDHNQRMSCKEAAELLALLNGS